VLRGVASRLHVNLVSSSTEKAGGNGESGARLAQLRDGTLANTQRALKTTWLEPMTSEHPAPRCGYTHTPCDSGKAGLPGLFRSKSRFMVLRLGGLRLSERQTRKVSRLSVRLRVILFLNSYKLSYGIQGLATKTEVCQIYTRNYDIYDVNSRLKIVQ
jgi:hypothetical protein